MVTDLHFDWIGQSYPDNRPTELLVPAEMGVRPVWNADGGNGWGAVIETPILGGVEIAGCSHSHPDVATAWDCATVMARNIAERVIAHQCSGSTAPIGPDESAEATAKGVSDTSLHAAPTEPSPPYDVAESDD